MRLLAVVMLLVVAAPARAWPPCNAAGLVGPVPVEQDAPPYPEAARELGIEGWAEVSLTVLQDGRTGWARVRRAEPPGYFEQAALAGVRRWRYEPARQDGAAVECRTHARLRFTLADTVGTAAGAAGQPEPVYPPALLAARVEGLVEVGFEWGPDGTAGRVTVLHAIPRGEFEQAALAAVRSWRHAGPDMPTGRQRRRFEFRLPELPRQPWPPAVLGSAPLPEAACREGMRARVRLEVVTDASGAVQSARILDAEPPRLFDAAALEIARQSRLTPARRDGQPVAATALLTLSFDSELAECSGARPDEPSRRRPAGAAPRVGRHDEPRDRRDGQFSFGAARG